MTMKQAQAILKKLGYYKLGVDGIKGYGTIKAIKQFQYDYGLTVDGIIGFYTIAALKRAAALDWNKIKYFKKSEFRCGCRGRYCNGYPVSINPQLVKNLETMRRHFGRPITITSGLRCRRYNNSLVGSIKTSKHRYGKAADIYVAGLSDTKGGREQVRRY